jgi:hypothetical protein
MQRHRDKKIVALLSRLCVANNLSMQGSAMYEYIRIDNFAFCGNGRIGLRTPAIQQKCMSDQSEIVYSSLRR